MLTNRINDSYGLVIMLTNRINDSYGLVIVVDCFNMVFYGKEVQYCEIVLARENICLRTSLDRILAEKGSLCCGFCHMKKENNDRTIRVESIHEAMQVALTVSKTGIRMIGKRARFDLTDQPY
ncbi:Aldolase-type TIM barrel [Parasponia andersonii]|uniref:Aldolase-type TIM barrel n=1 Tax=Parasponia andersonii TaxID=3476 RepID=A0A2P5DFP3_PARAD|nr:Aldolase-type TIM barrel [Parasponia andersonii]